MIFALKKGYHPDCFKVCFLMVLYLNVYAVFLDFDEVNDGVLMPNNLQKSPGLMTQNQSSRKRTLQSQCLCGLKMGRVE